MSPINVRGNSSLRHQTGSEQRYFSIAETITWLLIFTFGISSLTQLLVDLALFSSLIQPDLKSFKLRYFHPLVIFIKLLITLLISLILLKKAANSRCTPQLLQFLSIDRFHSSTTLVVLITSAFYYASDIYLRILFEIPLPQIMFDIKLQTTTLLSLILLATATIVIGPIFEELVFRGVIYSRLCQSRLGNVGAIATTSICFALLHFYRYEYFYMGQLLVGSILLAVIRHTTKNISYCILFHGLVNGYYLVELFLLN